MKKILSLGIAAVALAGLSGCSMNLFGEPTPKKLTYKEQVQQFFENYKTLKPNKAIAFTKGENGQYVFGQAFEYKSQAGAKARALKQCNDRRAQLKVEKSCKLLAVGDKFLEEISFK